MANNRYSSSVHRRSLNQSYAMSLVRKCAGALMFKDLQPFYTAGGHKVQFLIGLTVREIGRKHCLKSLISDYPKMRVCDRAKYKTFARFTAAGRTAGDVSRWSITATSTTSCRNDRNLGGQISKLNHQRLGLLLQVCTFELSPESLNGVSKAISRYPDEISHYLNR